MVTLAAVCRDDGRFSVSDNGRGMTPDVVARLFEPFSFFTTRSDGTGLGLAIARASRAHGGSIDVRSAPGVGTEFIITLP